MEIKQIRMGIVGAGTWGRTHASIYAEHLFADPVAICDMNEARAREIADEFGIRRLSIYPCRIMVADILSTSALSRRAILPIPLSSIVR